MSIPDWSQAPPALLTMDGHCGLLAAWQVLSHFGRRVPASRIASACGYTKRYGVFTIGLAAGLAELGLDVAFHSEPDSLVRATEKRGYSRARALGISIDGALSLDEVLLTRRRRAVPIVFYDTPSGKGHFSPLCGERDGRLLLPLDDNRTVRREDFLRRWVGPDVLRQAIIVNRRGLSSSLNCSTDRRPVL